jgi:hypothetical protein
MADGAHIPYAGVIATQHTWLILLYHIQLTLVQQLPRFNARAFFSTMHVQLFVLLHCDLKIALSRWPQIRPNNSKQAQKNLHYSQKKIGSRKFTRAA